MKIVIAIDSFKGSLSSMEAASAIRDGIRETALEAEIVIKPLADGGEGTVSTFVEGIGAKKIEMKATGPLGKPVECSYAVIDESKTAVIEIAAAAGLTQVPDSLKNPLNTTSYGVGEIIKDALDRGLRKFIIGIGGSATNDCGVGMLKALGFTFFNWNRKEAEGFGRDVAGIEAIDVSGADPRLRECSFRIACDVDNPLCGEKGASAVFGPQKGATKEMVRELDRGLLHFSRVVKKNLGLDLAEIPGAGAAGGLGYAFSAFLGGRLEPGISIVLDTVGIESELSDTDIVITGEGRLDFQTAMGKAPIGVARLAKKYRCKVIAFAGAVTPEAEECNREGIDAYFPIIQRPMGAEEAMEKETAFSNLKAATKQVFRLINCFHAKEAGAAEFGVR